MTTPISIFLIACNEAQRIARTIAAVHDLSDDIIVVDSGSTDGTQKIARDLGAKVIDHPWQGYGAQKRFAEEQCRHDWLLNLDADEVVTEDLNKEIQALFAASPKLDPGAYTIRIVDVLPGDSKPLPFAYAHKYVRLYHRSVGRFSPSSVHDVVQLEPDIRRRTLTGRIHHFSIVNSGAQLAKFNDYTDALVEDMRARGKRIPTWRLFVEFPIAFLKAYLLRRHFIRGTYGFVTAMNYAYFRYLRVAKCYESRMRTHQRKGD